MLIVAPVVGFFVCSMFCCALFCVLSSFAIILLVTIELVVLLFYFVPSSWCLVIDFVLWLSSRCCGLVCSIIVVIPDHTHLVFWIEIRANVLLAMICV